MEDASKAQAAADVLMGSEANKSDRSFKESRINAST